LISAPGFIVSSAPGAAQMIDVGIAVFGAIFYFTGRYGLALVLILPAIISGAGAVVRSIVTPIGIFKSPIPSEQP